MFQATLLKTAVFGAGPNLLLSKAENFHDFLEIYNVKLEHGYHSVSCQNSHHQRKWGQRKGTVNIWMVCIEVLTKQLIPSSIILLEEN